MNVAPTGERAKAFGAFYTDRTVADFLVGWAVRSAHDGVLDPSFGGGVFLEAAAERLGHLGGDVCTLYGVELDPEVHARVAGSLAARGLPPQNLIRADFFNLDAGTELLPPLDAVVGNPPFIRYQKFSGDVRAKALARSLEQGVRLSGRSSAWAPFLVHSVSLLNPGGRLGMVVPAELGHAAYARPVLRFLIESFASVTLLTFKEPLFPRLSQDTLLLLAEKRGSAFEGLFWRDVGSVRELKFLGAPPQTTRLDAPALLEGKDKLVSYFLSPDARELYQALASSGRVKRLGELTEVGIGYVTGANKFFHLGEEDVARWNIPQNFLRRAVFRGGALCGTRFGCEDWAGGEKNGDAGFLLCLDDTPLDEFPEGVRRYLEHGAAAGVHRAYKCRIRSPWYVVPHVHEADAFLTCMSGSRPQLLTNDAGAVAPNTLHIVRLRPRSPVSKSTLSALWLSSLTSLSVEVEGHALGGGLLKLEPSEARRVLVALPSKRLEGLTEELDALLRKGENHTACQRADEIILQGALGLSTGECNLLREAARTLRARRSNKQEREG